MTHILRNQIVARLNSHSSEQALRLTLQFWDVIAAELTPIVGKDGFAMLGEPSLKMLRYQQNSHYH